MFSSTSVDSRSLSMKKNELNRQEEELITWRKNIVLFGLHIFIFFLFARKTLIPQLIGLQELLALSYQCIKVFPMRQTLRLWRRFQSTSHSTTVHLWCSSNDISDRDATSAGGDTRITISFLIWEQTIVNWQSTRQVTAFVSIPRSVGEEQSKLYALITVLISDVRLVTITEDGFVRTPFYWPVSKLCNTHIISALYCPWAVKTCNW